MVGHRSAGTQRALVSYSAPAHFLASPNWSKVLESLATQLPLRNIHWKSASRTSVRTIQELDVTLVPLDSVKDEHTSQIPTSLLEKPLLHIYVVPCEDNDLEGYRNFVKKQIKEWHTSVSGRKYQDWLIVQIIRPDASRTPTPNFFQLKGSVQDKIKTDFNSDKRDRCLRVNWTSGNDNNALAWAEFANKMKDGLLFAFDSAVSHRHEEVKRSEGQQQMPGWNFCTFFILKESLATSHEGLNLFEEALLQYEELEAMFYKVWQEKNMSWFGSFINRSPTDDSSPLLSINKKPYRDLILANTISVFDIRIYILARQCELLAKMCRFDEITRRVCTFLGAFGRRIRDVENAIPAFFVESWIYSSALSVVDQCNTWVSKYSQEAHNAPTFSAGKGELLNLARSQLDIIGLQVGHLPTKVPFTSAILNHKRRSSNQSQKRASSKGNISNPSLLEAIQDTEKFYDLYVSTTNRAIEMYVKAGRRKFSLKLHGSLAALDLHRGRLESALTTYNSLPGHYAPHMWTSLESFMLSNALDIHTTLGKPRDVEWIHILLSYLKTYVESGGKELLLHDNDKTEYVSELVDAMLQAASNLETDLAHPNHPAMSVQVSSSAVLAGTRDGSTLDVTIWNHLPCTIPAESVVVTLGAKESDKLRFMGDLEGLPPGPTHSALFCPSPSSGTYAVDWTEVRVSHLLFQCARAKRNHSGNKVAMMYKKAFDNLVTIPYDPEAFNLNVTQSNRIELGKAPHLMVVVKSGRNEISRLVLKMSTTGVTFKFEDAVLVEGQRTTGSCELEGSDDAIILTNISADHEVKVLVPHSDASSMQAMRINFDVEYVTSSEPSIQRSCSISRVLLTTLPLAVNVEDFFRGSRVISKFTVSTTSHQHVRISGAYLEASEEGMDALKITSPSSRRVVTVTPAQPANFLFSLDSPPHPVRESLTLRIKYRMLREEVETLIEDQVRRVLSDSPASQQHKFTIVSKLIEALERDATWVELYGITGELVVPEVQDPNVEIVELLNDVRKFLREHKHTDPEESQWREIRIPVDVPHMNIVAAACMQVNPSTIDDPTFYAGQPIFTTLTIHTSFHWSSISKTKEVRYMMRYSVEETVRDWLISGPKRGNFVAMDDTTHTVSVTLIALHHGELALPSVTVAPLPIDGDVTMSTMALPSTETHQVHGAERILIRPRGGRSTFVVNMGST